MEKRKNVIWGGGNRDNITRKNITVQKKIL